MFHIIGEFAKVYKGHYYTDNKCTTVAVKALKGIAILVNSCMELHQQVGILDRHSSDSVKEFIEESLVMQDLDHPNVMGLIGICLDAGPSPLIILPYMEGA